MLTPRAIRHLAMAVIVAGCLATTGAPFVGDRADAKKSSRSTDRQRPDIVLVTIDALRAE